MTVDEAKRVVIIFGQNLDSFGTQIVKRVGQLVPTFLPITMPLYIMENHKVDTLYMVFYVNGNRFSRSITRTL